MKAAEILNNEIENTRRFLKSKDFISAENKINFLLKHDDQNPDVLELIGDIYFEQKNYKKSIWFYISAIEKNDQNIGCLVKVSENLFYLKNFSKCLVIINKIIEIDPSKSYPYILLGLCHQEIGNENDAINAFQNSIDINPKEILGYLNLGLLYKKNKNYEEAITIYQKAIAKNPGNHFILSNLGNLFYLQRKFDDAILSHERAIKAKPESPIVYYNYANTLLHAGKVDESNKTYQKAIQIDKNFYRAHVNLGTNLLTYKNFEDGFKEYSWRIFYDEYINLQNKKNKKIWTGEDIKGKTILVCSEQGYGNIIQFSRYLSVLSEYECKIIFSCPDEIMHLFGHLEFIHEIVSIDHNIEEFDYWIPLQSLVPLLSPNPAESCPMPTSIAVNDNKLLEWETLLEVDNKVKIGICWQGNVKNPRDHMNSIDLQSFKKILKIENTSFISLQKGHGHHQIAKNNLQSEIIDYDLLIDTGNQKFLDTSAIIKYLDLVITTDTSIAHLAGSLGVQTWLLLPKLCDWRWFQDTDETIWYDNMRLFRQKEAGNWDDVLKTVHDEALNLSRNLYEIRRDQNTFDEKEDNNVQEIIPENDNPLETQSMEDFHNENVPISESKYSNNDSETNNQIADTEMDDDNPNISQEEEFNTEFNQTDAAEQIEDNNLSENKDDDGSAQNSESSVSQEKNEVIINQNSNQDESTNIEEEQIVPKVLRDDDGGEKIKFKR